MSNATRSSKKSPALVGEICLYGTSATGAGWAARGDGTAYLGNGEPRQGRAFTEAVWQAAEALRGAGVDGVVAIYAAGGEMVALAHLGNVPTYGSLRWQAADGLTISAAAILEASR